MKSIAVYPKFETSTIVVNGLPILYGYSFGYFMGFSRTSYTSSRLFVYDNSFVDTDGIVFGQSHTYNPRLPGGIRDNWYVMRGFVKFDTKCIGNLLTSGYRFASCQLVINPNYVYYDNDWNLVIYFDSGKRGNSVSMIDAGMTNNIYYDQNSNYAISGYDNIIFSWNDVFIGETEFEPYFLKNLFWDYFASCFDQVAATVSVSGNFSAGLNTFIQIPLYCINVSGCTELKFVNENEFNQSSPGGAGETTASEYISCGTDDLYLKFSLFQMKTLRLTDMSVIYTIQDMFNNAASISGYLDNSVSDGYPETPDGLSLPEVVVEHLATADDSVQIAGDYMYYVRDFGIEIFAKNFGELDDIINILHSGFSDTLWFPIYDWNMSPDGPADILPIIGYFEITDIRSVPINDRSDHVNLKNRSSLIISTRSKMHNYKFDNFYLNIGYSNWYDMVRA
jgi:hypothetical protein